VKAIGRRLSRLEHQFGPSAGQPRDYFRIIVRRMDRKVGLDGATCTRTLLPGGIVSEVVRLDKGSGVCEPTDHELDAWVAGFPIELPDGRIQVRRLALHNFGGGSAGDEAEGIVLDSAGNLFGATGFGGGPGCFEDSGCGLAFGVGTAGNYNVIYTFTGGADGTGGALSVSPQGELYGVGAYGTEGGGILYKLTF
jgi:hypothetical protein